MSCYLQCTKLRRCHKDRIGMQRVSAFGFSGTLIQLVDKIFSYPESLERCQNMIWEISVDLVSGSSLKDKIFNHCISYGYQNSHSISIQRLLSYTE